MSDVFAPEKEAKVYFYIRTSTKVYNYGTDDEEIGDTNVYIKGVYDYEHAREQLEKSFSFETLLGKETVIRKESQEFKLVSHYSDNFGYLIEEFFDSTRINSTLSQPVFEGACVTFD